MLFGPVPRSDKLACEEVFGPVLAAMPFDDEADAIALANATDYGLVAGVWTEDGGRQLRVAKRIKVGQVFINATARAAASSCRSAASKKSGHGREKGFIALEEFERHQDDRAQAWLRSGRGRPAIRWARSRRRCRRCRAVASSISAAAPAISCGRWRRAGPRSRASIPTRPRLEQARLAAPSADIRSAPAEALPFDGGAFQAAIFLNSLHHVPEPAMAAALAEAARVVGKGGDIIVVEPLAEGSFFAALMPVEDETAARDAAQRAVARALGDGRLRLARQHEYDRVESYPDIDAFLARIVLADPGRVASVSARPAPRSRGGSRRWASAARKASAARLPSGSSISPCRIRRIVIASAVKQSRAGCEKVGTGFSHESCSNSLMRDGFSFQMEPRSDSIWKHPALGVAAGELDRFALLAVTGSRSHPDHMPDRAPLVQRVEALIDLVEPARAGEQLVDRQPAPLVEVDEARDVAHRDAGADIGALQVRSSATRRTGESASVCAGLARPAVVVVPPRRVIW